MSGWIDTEYMRIPVPNVTKQMRDRSKFMVEALKNAKGLPTTTKRKVQSISVRLH